MTAAVRWRSVGGPLGVLPLLPLGGLLLLLPPVLTLSTLFAYNEGERQLVGALELAFVALALCDRTVSPSRLSPRLRLVLAAWIASTALATVLAAHPMAASIRQAEWYLHAVFAWVLSGWLRADPHRSVWLAVGISAGFVVYAIQLAVFTLGLEDANAHAWNFAMPAFGNARHFAYYATSVLPYLVALQVGSRRLSARRLSLLATSTIAWSLLLWSGGRIALAAIAGSLVLLSIRNELEPRAAAGRGGVGASTAAWRTAVAWTVATAVLGVWLSTLLPSITRKGPGAVGLSHIVHLKAPSEDATTVIGSVLSRFDRGRLELWTRAEAEIADYPWLGIGPDGFGFLPTPDGAAQPHSIVFQALLEWGLVGASCFGLLLVAGIWLAWRRARPAGADLQNAARLGALGSLLATVLYSLLDGTLYSAFPSMLAACSLAIATQPVSEQAGGGSRPAASGGSRPAASGGSRAAALGVASLLLPVVVGYWLVRLSLWPAHSPPPDSARARIVRALPFQVEPVAPEQGSLGVFDWAIAWWETDRSVALDWLHWGHAHARRPWHYYHMEARLSWIAGDRERALRHVRSALQHAETLEQRLSSHALLRALNER